MDFYDGNSLVVSRLQMVTHGIYSMESSHYLELDESEHAMTPENDRRLWTRIAVYYFYYDCTTETSISISIFISILGSMTR